jgi:hypothetical protein
MSQPELPEIDYSEPLNRAFAQIDAGVELAIATFNDIVDQVRRWFWSVAPPVLLWVRRRLGEVREALREVVDRVERAAEHQAPVLALISTSFAWLEQVRMPVSGCVSAIAEPADDRFVAWTGDAATAYATKVDRQLAAAAEVAERADFISRWLFDIARANVDYAIELARIVTALAGKLVEAAIEIGTVIDIPWAIEALSEATGDLVRAGLDNLLRIGERFVDAIGNVRDVQAKLSDHSRLPGGHWPQAVHG